jgi:hypothetical protein
MREIAASQFCNHHVDPMLVAVNHIGPSPGMSVSRQSSVATLQRRSVYSGSKLQFAMRGAAAMRRAAFANGRSVIRHAHAPSSMCDRIARMSVASAAQAVKVAWPHRSSSVEILSATGPRYKLV